MASTTRKFIAFQLDGVKELAALFEQLPKSLTDAVLRNTGKRALVPVLAFARAIVSKHDGDLAKSMAISTKLSKNQRRRFRKTGDVEVYAGPTNPRGAHGHLVEFGTKARFQKSTGKFVGVMPAQPFMRPAWDTLSGAVLEVFRKEIWDVLRAAVRRLRKRSDAGKLSSRQQAPFIS